MAKVIQCPCGYLIRERDDDRLVESAQSHAWSAHGIELTREQALAMAKPELTGRRSNHGESTKV
jgi:predicted small metal-binding protein